MIQIKNLSFRYSSGKSVLENINLEIKEGEVLSVIGKNGAGKSSLVRLIAGIMKPTKGEILVDAMNVQDPKMAKEIRKKLGIVFQNPENQILFPNVYDDLLFALKNLGLDNPEERIRNALKKVEMEDFIKQNSYELSLGQKQRINIASVLAVGPRYIILDEPTTMIDSQGKDKIHKIVRSLKKEGYTIIYVTNLMEEILLSDRILILEDRKIKTIFPKTHLLENVKQLEESHIKIPEILQIILALRKKNIEFPLQEWTMEEMVSKIVRVCET